MNDSYKLSSDFLATGLTKPSLIFGVPHFSALLNFVVNFFAGFICCLLTASFTPAIIFFSSLMCLHMLMAKISIDDSRVIDILLKKPINLPNKKDGYLNKYYPLSTYCHPKSGVNHQEKTAKNYIPYDVLIDDYTISTKDGLLIQFISLDGIANQTLDDIDIDCEKEGRNRLYAQITNPNIAIQYYLVKSKVSAYPEGEYDIDFADSFNEKYKSKLAGKQFFEHKYTIAIIHKGVKKVKHGWLGKLFSYLDGSNTMVSDTEKEAIDALNSLSKKICQSFEHQNASRLSVYSENKEHYSAQLGFINQLLNFKSQKIRVPSAQISDYLSHKEHAFAEQKGVIQVKSADGSSKYAGILSLKEYPNSSRADLFDTLLDEDIELILSQSFEFIAKNKATKKVEQQYDRMTNSDEASETKTDELLVTLEDLKSGEIELGSHNLSLCIIADSEEELSKNIEKIDSALSQKSSLIMCRETKGCEIAFWSMLPGNMRFNVREGDISSINFAAFASPHNYPKGKMTGNHWGDALSICETLAGTAFAFNYHVGQVATSTLIGPSGTGKTAVLATTLCQSIKYGGYRFIFDRDEGMSVLVRALGGQYSTLKMGVKTGMAPLQMEKSESARAFNIMILKTILKTEKGLTTGENKLIEKVVDRAYALPKHQRIFKNIAPFFGAQHEESLRERFDRWHSNGENAWVFDNDIDSFEINSKIFALDLTELLSGSKYQEVKNPLIMYLFERIGLLIDGSPTMISIPEGWQVLQDEMLSPRIAAWSRTNRKNEVALVMDTQSIEEFSQSIEKAGGGASSGGSSMVREAVTNIFFANAKADKKTYDAFNLTDKEFNIIKHQLEAKKDQHYFLLKQGGQSVVARFPLHGLNDELAILSPNKKQIAVGKIVGSLYKEPSQFVSTYLAEISNLKNTHNGNLKSWEAAFKEHHA